jgi:hypothetical protein
VDFPATFTDSLALLPVRFALVGAWKLEREQNKNMLVWLVADADLF